MIPTSHDDHAGVGMRAGWALDFLADDGPVPVQRVLGPVTSDHYDATIEATLPGGLEGGSYSVVVEGLTDADHLALAGRTPRSTVLRLYLFWYRTTGVGGYLAGAAGLTGALGGPSGRLLADRLVAELTVASVTRRPGTRRYETVITARERVFERLTTHPAPPVCVETPKRAVELAAEHAGVQVLHEDKGFQFDGTLPGSASSAAAAAATTFVRGQTCRDALVTVARVVEQAHARHGRGVLLIRDGALHVGVRSGSVGGAEVLDLTPRTGLLDVGGAAAGNGPKVARTLVLKGRPDLKPGALVRFDLPPSERSERVTPSIGQAVARSLGAVGPPLPGLSAAMANPQLLYLESVAHRLGRTSSFVTTITGVEVATPGGDAELYDPPPADEPTASRTERGSGDPAERAALVLRRQVTQALGALRMIDAGEVRAAAAAGAGDAQRPPRRTSTVWRGLADPDGHPNRLTRRPVRRDRPDERQRVPQASPFAWGSTGLVVPRYPGTRVLLGHGGGEADDPVDLGAVWETGQGPDAQPGDWWLILPAGVPATIRESLPGSAAPRPYTGPVTQDLIDADGNRVIEVGELTVRVTRTKLGAAGDRAQRAGGSATTPADSVSIEHADAGSSIVMTPDGTVRITAKKIELDAGAGGEISLNARSVRVTVADTMDVSKK